MTERLEKQQKLEVEKKKRAKHLEFISALLQHGREFRDFHRNTQSRIQKTNKIIMTYHANYDREKRKEEERLERERLRMLMVSCHLNFKINIDLDGLVILPCYLANSFLSIFVTSFIMKKFL